MALRLIWLRSHWLQAKGLPSSTFSPQNPQAISNFQRGSRRLRLVTLTSSSAHGSTSRQRIKSCRHTMSYHIHQIDATRIGLRARASLQEGTYKLGSLSPRHASFWSNTDGTSLIVCGNIGMHQFPAGVTTRVFVLRFHIFARVIRSTTSTARSSTAEQAKHAEHWHREAKGRRIN